MAPKRGNPADEKATPLESFHLCDIITTNGSLLVFFTKTDSGQ
jgi:hypothetical protein